MAFRRPSFLPSLNDLEQQAQDRSAARSRPGSNFDHPTAKAVFIAVLIITVVTHVVGGIALVLMR